MSEDDTIRIETLSEDDTAEAVAAFARLLPQLSRSATPLDETAVARILRSDAATVLVARLGGTGGTGGSGEIVGTLTLVVFPVPSGLRARIEDVVVDAAARGRGVAALLTRRALDLAAEHGARTVDLTSRPDREAANRLYRRLGFTARVSTVFRHDPDHG